MEPIQFMIKRKRFSNELAETYTGRVHKWSTDGYIGYLTSQGIVLDLLYISWHVVVVVNVCK